MAIAFGSRPPWSSLHGLGEDSTASLNIRVLRPKREWFRLRCSLHHKSCIETKYLRVYRVVLYHLTPSLAGIKLFAGSLYSNSCFPSCLKVDFWRMINPSAIPAWPQYFWLHSEFLYLAATCQYLDGWEKSVFSWSAGRDARRDKDCSCFALSDSHNALEGRLPMPPHPCMESIETIPGEYLWLCGQKARDVLGPDELGCEESWNSQAGCKSQR